MHERLVSVPARLTAENGAKAALMGEFKVEYEMCCFQCDGAGCDECNDRGSWVERHIIPWDTVKEIYSAAITHFESAGGSS
ncbi:hypothetical protein NG99_23590 [Erwinia typographi]|uniref:Uncharacterized protein n=1 Tax=Erwinia typographi TaxID=371042 RepID=A0A0A3YK86_9GAMM|nr:hypothetical protein NG99_23590 [Erwinia typographi]